MASIVFATEQEFFDWQDQLPEEIINDLEADFSLSPQVTATYENSFDTEAQAALTRAQNGDPVPSADPVEIEADLDVIRGDIASVQSDIVDVQSDIVTNTNAVSANTAGIVTNGNQISANTAAVAANTTAINDNTTALGLLDADVQQNSADIQSNGAAITANSDAIGVLSSDVATLNASVASLQATVADMLGNQESNIQTFSGVEVSGRAWRSIGSINSITIAEDSTWIINANAIITNSSGNVSGENAVGTGVRILINGNVVALNEGGDDGRAPNSGSSVSTIQALFAGDVVEFEVTHESNRRFVSGRFSAVRPF